MDSACAHMELFATTVGSSRTATPATTGTAFESGYRRATHLPTKNASAKSKTTETILIAARSGSAGRKKEIAASRVR